MEVALATYAELPGFAKDELLLIEALGKRGLRAELAVWDDPDINWSAPKVCVIRSTWDYHLRLAEFLAWAERVSAVTSLWNPIEAIRWNSHKAYLRELEQRDVPIVPTTWLRTGTQADLERLVDERGWGRIVIKPAVSASAYATLAVARNDLDRGQAHLEEWLPRVEMMVQPYMASVETYGERSLIYIDGTLSHAVQRPAVLVEEGHTVTAVSPSRDEVDIAGQVLHEAGFSTLYARVDLAQDDDGRPRLMELELVEPSLFLEHGEQAAERLAKAIADRCPQ